MSDREETAGPKAGLSVWVDSIPFVKPLAYYAWRGKALIDSRFPQKH